MSIIKQNKRKSNVVHIKVKKHYDRNKGHYHAILENIDDNHLSIGFTRDRFKGKNHPNYPLKYDPLQKGQMVYMKRQATIDKVNSYGSKVYSAIMDPKDFEKAKEYGQRAKDNYYKKKK